MCAEGTSIWASITVYELVVEGIAVVIVVVFVGGRNDAVRIPSNSFSKILVARCWRERPEMTRRWQEPPLRRLGAHLLPILVGISIVVIIGPKRWRERGKEGFLYFVGRAEHVPLLGLCGGSA
jgi:hypothetical protein